MSNYHNKYKKYKSKYKYMKGGGAAWYNDKWECYHGEKNQNSILYSTLEAEALNLLGVRPTDPTKEGYIGSPQEMIGWWKGNETATMTPTNIDQCLVNLNSTKLYQVWLSLFEAGKLRTLDQEEGVRDKRYEGYHKSHIDFAVSIQQGYLRVWINLTRKKQIKKKLQLYINLTITKMKSEKSEKSEIGDIIQSQLESFKKYRDYQIDTGGETDDEDIEKETLLNEEMELVDDTDDIVTLTSIMENLEVS